MRLRPTLRIFASLLASVAARAESPSVAQSLEGAQSAFLRSMDALTDQLDRTQKDGCLADPKMLRHVRDAQAVGKQVRSSVKKEIEALAHAVAQPMRTADAGICDGTYQTLIKEVDGRRDRITRSRSALQKAGFREAVVLHALNQGGTYEVTSAACGVRSIQAFRASVDEALAGLGSLKKLDDSLESENVRLGQLNDKHRTLLAGCGGSTAAAPVRGEAAAKAPGSALAVPKGKSAAPASDITGLPGNAAGEKR